jgi:hypothetical protein
MQELLWCQTTSYFVFTSEVYMLPVCGSKLKNMYHKRLKNAILTVASRNQLSLHFICAALKKETLMDYRQTTQPK